MTARITLALLVIIPAAMAYPWRTVTERWVLGVAVAVVVIVFAWWGGQFATTRLRRRIALWRRNHSKGSHSKRSESPASVSTVALRFDDSGQDVPLDLIAGYLDRYGIRSDKVRVTSCDIGGSRTTWVALTVSAADNLAALQARSPRLPLRETVEVATRRLGDHLRENGHAVSPADAPQGPSVLSGTETWRGVRSEAGFLAAYRIKVTDQLSHTLDAVWAHPSPETWTAIEFTGTARFPEIAAACAYRTTDRPGAKAPVAGLSAQGGLHRPALTALNPKSDTRLAADAAALPDGLLAELRWPITFVPTPQELTRT